MSDSAKLLDLIENGIVEHGGDLGGWTRRTDDALQLFDGRVTLRAEIKEQPQESRSCAIHAHILATMPEYDDEVLDACLMGIGTDHEAALGEIAVIWITGVAGPIKSFLDNKPVCMTCQAGVSGGDASKGYAPGDYGLPGLRAYVGPSFSRQFGKGDMPIGLDDSKPWFQFAAESAAPRRIHLAKATVLSDGPRGWSRDLEIDGHDVSHRDPNWDVSVPGPEFSYLIRFAVFEFPRNSKEIQRRAELERTIRHFARNFTSYESAQQLMGAMIREGFDPELVHETESISTIAFGRLLFEHHGVQYSSTVIRARKDGTIQRNVPLMSIPAFSRARALATELQQSMSEDDFLSLCLYNAESNAISQAMEHQGDDLDLSQVRMFPCIVPDADVSDATMDTAFAALTEMIDQSRPVEKKPWWKFW